MYVSGVSFEQIAKFLGHAGPQVTASVYGRLRCLDALGAMAEAGVPFLQDAGAEARREEWMDLGRLLRDPWRAATEEWEGLPGP